MTDDYAVPGKACFIESVWIDPQLRKHGVGRRLVTYLIERQRRVGVQDFYLWVINDNGPAMRLYERMGFKRTGRKSEFPETQFLRAFGSKPVGREELENSHGERDTDDRDFGITYRMLDPHFAMTDLPRSSEAISR